GRQGSTDSHRDSTRRPCYGIARGLETGWQGSGTRRDDALRKPRARGREDQGSAVFLVRREDQGSAVFLVGRARLIVRAGFGVSRGALYYRVRAWDRDVRVPRVRGGRNHAQPVRVGRHCQCSTPTVIARRGRRTLARHHASIHECFLPVRATLGGADRSPAMIRRRVSAGSITSSISKSAAAFSALPFSYMAATISSYFCLRAAGSSIAASSLRYPSFTAPSSPMPPNSPVGQDTAKNGA